MATSTEEKKIVPEDEIEQDSETKETTEEEEVIEESDLDESDDIPLGPGRSFLRDLLSETIIGFIFWSLFHGLAPMIWFYPLNELEISGYEALAVVWFIPIICTSQTIFKAIQSRTGIFVLRAVCVAAIGSFQAPTTLSRLLILSVGNGAAILLLCATWWHKTSHQRLVSFWGFMLGFMALLESRIWYKSITPTWSDTTSNSVVIAFGVIATLDRLRAPEHPLPEAKGNSKVADCSFRNGIGLGSLLFLMHWVYSEVSIVSRWVVQGIPFHGPHPFPAGAAIFIEMLTGLLMSSKREVTSHFLWNWFVGGHCAVGLYYFNSFLGFTCGLFLGVYIMSIWPEMADRATSSSPVKTLLFAMATYLFEMLFSVWTTAFNFVPGGTLTREGTMLLMIFVIFNIVRAVVSGEGRDPKSKKSKHVAFTNLDGTGCYQAFADAKILLILILIIAMGGFGVRYNYRTKPQPQQTNPGEFTSLIWTAHFMYDNKGWPSFERAAQMLEDSGADVITLLESDASKPYLGNNDISMWLGERLSMYDDFGPSTRSHTWGNLLLSKYPILRSEHHLLPSPHGELAPAVSATLNISGSLVDFVATHMGNDRDDLDRKLQTGYLANITRKSKNPTVFMGYVTSKPGSRDYKKFTTYGKLKDIDSTDKDRFCEYIMYKGLIRVGYARISHGGLSDTEVQMAKFHIPTAKNYKDNEKVVTDTSKVDPSVLFTDKFGALEKHHHYGADHHYHMNTPKYFIKEL